MIFNVMLFDKMILLYFFGGLYIYLNFFCMRIIGRIIVCFFGELFVIV